MYKVCILTAGKGTRNKYAQDTNKALLNVGGKNAITHLIDKFPQDVEIVIALGHRAGMVQASTSVLHPKRRLQFVYVDKAGRGPGYSLLCCQKHLQCPFIYMACDTLVLEPIPEPARNWLGLAWVGEKKPYLTVDIDDGLVTQVYDKGDKDASYLASIGLVGVKDYKTFWKGLAKPTIVQGEHQDTSGINALIPHKLHWEHFTWFDTGTTEGYEYANRCFGGTLP